MLRRSILAAMALVLAAPAMAMQSAAPLGPASPQTAAASSSPTPQMASSRAAPNPSPKVRALPHWERTPSRDDIVRHFPRQALNQNLSGRAVMTCKIRKDGTLTDCTLVGEEPVGHGFGEAALAMVRYFKMSPTTADGTSVEGVKVTIPIRWQLK